MNQAFEISDIDVQTVLADSGVQVSLTKAERLLGTLNRSKIEQAALFGNVISEQTRYAHEEIRNQLAQGGEFDDQIAEWIGQHYKLNFDAVSNRQKASWRSRWVETMNLLDAEA